MAAAVTKDDVKEIVEGAFGKLDAELKHVNSTLIEFKADMRTRIDGLPCDRLDGEVKELSVRFKMREEEFEKTARERKEMIDGAWSFARAVKENAYPKEAGEKLEEKLNANRDKWETRLYALLTAIMLALFKFKVI